MIKLVGGPVVIWNMKFLGAFVHEVGLGINSILIKREERTPPHQERDVH